MKFKTTFLFILAGIFFGNMMFAQTVAESEKQYIDRQTQIERRQSHLDSLNAILEKQVAAIDAEKQKPDSDKSTLRRLMANGLEVTEKINRFQQELAGMQRDQEILKENLAQKYIGILDSLQQLETAGKYSGNPQHLRQEIVSYTEKYLLLSPSFKALSFDPQEISGINLAETSDSLERAISRDYLEQAIADVDSHLQHIEKNREELENIVRLEEKTREFLEDIDDEQFGVFTQSADFAVTEQSANGVQDASPSSEGFGLSTQDQLQSIALFFDQLNIDLTENQIYSWHSPIDSAQMTISLDEYLKLLKEAEKRLKQYHSVISNKLDKTNSN